MNVIRGGGGRDTGKIRCEIVATICKLAHSEHSVPQLGNVGDGLGEWGSSRYLHLQEHAREGLVVVDGTGHYQHLKIVSFLDMKQDHFEKNLCHKHFADGCFLYRGGRVLLKLGAASVFAQLSAQAAFFKWRRGSQY